MSAAARPSEGAPAISVKGCRVPRSFVCADGPWRRPDTGVKDSDASSVMEAVHHRGAREHEGGMLNGATRRDTGAFAARIA